MQEWSDLWSMLRKNLDWGRKVLLEQGNEKLQSSPSVLLYALLFAGFQELAHRPFLGHLVYGSPSHVWWPWPKVNISHVIYAIKEKLFEQQRILEREIPQEPSTLHLITTCVLYLNTIINPLIYAMSASSMRNRILTSIRPRQSSSHSVTEKVSTLLQQTIKENTFVQLWTQIIHSSINTLLQLVTCRLFSNVANILIHIFTREIKFNIVCGFENTNSSVAVKNMVEF